jgi:hypothetical protein
MIRGHGEGMEIPFIGWGIQPGMWINCMNRSSNRVSTMELTTIAIVASVAAISSSFLAALLQSFRVSHRSGLFNRARVKEQPVKIEIQRLDGRQARITLDPTNLESIDHFLAEMESMDLVNHNER